MFFFALDEASKMPFFFSWLYRKMKEPVIYIDPQKVHDHGQDLTLQKYKKKSTPTNE
jgi:hypothetical protein